MNTDVDYLINLQNKEFGFEKCLRDPNVKPGACNLIKLINLDRQFQYYNEPVRDYSGCDENPYTPECMLLQNLMMDDPDAKLFGGRQYAGLVNLNNKNKKKHKHLMAILI